MTGAGARPIAPSSKLALYLASLAAAYLIRDPVAVIVFGFACVTIALVVIAKSSRPVPHGRWRAAAIFVVWVFLMRAALELVAGVPASDPTVWLTAGRQSARVAVLAVGVIALIAVTRPRDIVTELEGSRIPRAVRILVMMLVQYPRVLRDRYEQIVEAQVARGAERPRTVVQRVSHGAALLLPVMQSELNAIGERATLIHLRGLDHQGPVSRRAVAVDRRDLLPRLIAGLLIAGALAARFMS